MISETIWDSRFQYVDELKRMGANIKVDGRVAVIEGVGHLTGAPVKSTDLRAGAGMVIAALIARGRRKSTLCTILTAAMRIWRASSVRSARTLSGYMNKN